jgi:hypothetical protein
MPAKSKAQFRAMQAAAHGKSTLGISPSVGKDFVQATSSPKSLPERKAKERKKSQKQHMRDVLK